MPHGQVREGVDDGRAVGLVLGPGQGEAGFGHPLVKEPELEETAGFGLSYATYGFEIVGFGFFNRLFGDEPLRLGLDVDARDAMSLTTPTNRVHLIAL